MIKMKILTLINEGVDYSPVIMLFLYISNYNGLFDSDEESENDASLRKQKRICNYTNSIL